MSDSIVLITGGSRGIGAASARILAQQGFSVAIGYAAHPEAAETLAQELRAEGKNALAVRCDVRCRESIDQAVRTVQTHMGHIDTLVCCAGIARQQLFSDITEQDWDELFDVNTKGVYRSVQAVLPSMFKKGHGCIVTVSSMWGQVGASCESAYAASKGAVIALSRSLAKELGPSGIRVNCVAPGTILTDMTLPLGEETLTSLANDTPLGRNGEPQDTANAIAFLCSDASAFITGQVLAVNGGFII